MSNSSSSQPLLEPSTRNKNMKLSVTTDSLESQSSVASVVVKDDLQLQELGYKQHMKRGFNMWSMTAFCLAGLGMLPSIAGTLWFSLGYYGFVSMTWGWLIGGLFIHTMVFTMAELGSAYPTAGGLYYWTYVAAPPKIKRVACWITAWSMVACVLLSGASLFMTQADMVTSFVIMFYDPNSGDMWVPTPWQSYLVYLFHIIICGIIISFPSRVLGHFSTIFAWLGTATFFALTIALPICAGDRHNTAKQIFTEGYDQTNWNNDVLAFLLTFLTPCWVISGYDSTVHLAEETTNAAHVVPNAMWMSTVSMSIVGWIFNIILAYVTTSIDTVMTSPLGQPLGAIMVLAMGNGALTKTLWFLTIISNFGVLFVITTAASRIYFAYARDGALPFSTWMSHVNTVTKTPVNATVTICTLTALLGLISIGSTTALNAFFSGSSISGAVAYMMPLLMRCLYENNPDYKPGPFSLGKWSKPLRRIAVLWCLFTMPLFCFPEGPNPTAKTFKWTVVFYIALMAIVVPWYLFRAHKWFVGPGEVIRD